MPALKKLVHHHCHPQIRWKRDCKQRKWSIASPLHALVFEMVAFTGKIHGILKHQSKSLILKTKMHQIVLVPACYVCLQECVPQTRWFFPSILTNFYYQFRKHRHIFQKCVTLPHAPKRCFMARETPRRFRTHSIHLKLMTTLGSHVFS